MARQVDIHMFVTNCLQTKNDRNELKNQWVDEEKEETKTKWEPWST